MSNSRFVAPSWPRKRLAVAETVIRILFAKPIECFGRALENGAPTLKSLIRGRHAHAFVDVLACDVPSVASFIGGFTNAGLSHGYGASAALV